MVRVTKTKVNSRNGIRYIYAESRLYSLTLTCNAEQPTCEVPAVGRSHRLIARPRDFVYDCNDYDLQYIDPEGVEHRTIACLDEAFSKSK